MKKLKFKKIKLFPKVIQPERFKCISEYIYLPLKFIHQRYFKLDPSICITASRPYY